MINSEKYLIREAKISANAAAYSHPQEKKKYTREEPLRRRQRPSTIDELGGGDVRAGDAERDDLPREERQDERSRPHALPPRSKAGCERTGGGEDDRRKGLLLPGASGRIVPARIAAIHLEVLLLLILGVCFS